MDDFLCFLTKWGTFCNFLLKSSPKRRNMIVCSKSWKFWPNRRFFVLFDEMSHFLQLFSKKLTKTPNHDSLLEKLQVLAKSTIPRAFSRNEALFGTLCRKVHQNLRTWYFVQKVASFWRNRGFFVLFHEMRHFLELFAEKFTKSFKHGSLLEKLQVFGQVDDFSCFFTKWGTFCNVLLKSSPKRRNMIVCSKSCKIWPNRWFFVVFLEMRHLLAVFAQKLTKTPKGDSLLEKLQGLVKSMSFRGLLRNEPLFASFCSKVEQNAETW